MFVDWINFLKRTLKSFTKLIYDLLHINYAICMQYSICSDAEIYIMLNLANLWYKL